MYLEELYLVGRQEFPIVKDTTPNMMNPRLNIFVLVTILGHLPVILSEKDKGGLIWQQ